MSITEPIDWSKVKFRASSWGNLMAEPKSKSAKDNGELSESCKSELYKIYNQVKYGRKKEIVTAAMDKGKLVEADSIKVYSMLEGELYQKNEVMLENEWFTGTPDIFLGPEIRRAEKVDDMKNSWELDSFIPWVQATPDRSGVCQMNVYYDLTGAKSGNLVRILMDCPPEVLEGEKYKLLRSMNVISEESPEFKEAYNELVRNLTFPDIPYEERVIKIPIHRDDELIQKMKEKVPIMRQWLADFEKQHLSQYGDQ